MKSLILPQGEHRRRSRLIVRPLVALILGVLASVHELGAQSLDIQGVELRIGMSADSALSSFKRLPTVRVGYEPSSGWYYFFTGDELLGRRGMIQVKDGVVTSIRKIFLYDGVMTPTALDQAFTEMAKRVGTLGFQGLFSKGCVWSDKLELYKSEPRDDESMRIEVLCDHYELFYSVNEAMSASGRTLRSSSVWVRAY